MKVGVSDEDVGEQLYLLKMAQQEYGLDSASKPTFPSKQNIPKSFRFYLGQVIIFLLYD